MRLATPKKDALAEGMRIMSQSAFFTTAAKRVAELGRTYGLDNNRAFLVWASSLLWGLEEEDALEAVMDRPNDKHVDFFWYDDVSDRILVAQGKYPDSPTKTPKVRDLNAFPSCLGWLAQPEALAREGRPDIQEEDAMKYTTELIAELRATPEGKEGMEAFLQKRKASWCRE